MFFSDEPGYYEDGNFGIRLETILRVVSMNLTDTTYGKSATAENYIQNLVHEFFSGVEVVEYTDFTLSTLSLTIIQIKLFHA